MEIVVKSFAETVVAFVLAGVLLRTNPLEIVLCIIAGTAFVALLVSVNLLTKRIFANVISQGILLLLYMLFIIIVMLPGVIGAIICAVVLEGVAGMLLALAVLTLWEVLLTALFFFLSRGVLHTTDIDTMPSNSGA